MEGKIYNAISAVMEDIGAVGKNDVNKTQGFSYRGIDAVMNALNPAMTRHKVFCAPEVLEQTREERTTKGGTLLIYSVCKIRYRFYTTDGSYVDVVTVGEGMDSGDKATNKAMSIAFKYACFQVFCIPTKEMTDPDAESPEASRKKEQKRDADNQDHRITEDMIRNIESEIERTGIDPGEILKLFHINTYSELTLVQYTALMNKFKKTKSRSEA